MLIVSRVQVLQVIYLDDHLELKTNKPLLLEATFDVETFSRVETFASRNIGKVFPHKILPWQVAFAKVYHH